MRGMYGLFRGGLQVGLSVCEGLRTSDKPATEVCCLWLGCVTAYHAQTVVVNLDMDLFFYLECFLNENDYQQQQGRLGR